MVLNKFEHLNSARVRAQPKPQPIAADTPPLILPDDTVNVTLADQSPISKGYVTVHRLADYRRKNSSILLVPDVESIIDIFLFSRDEVAKCVPTL